MTENTLVKWYNNKPLLIILFFVFPPIGIYGMLKHRTETWKKVVYILPSALIILITLTAIIAAISTDHYKVGIDNYNKKEYMEAHRQFLRVSPEDLNYKDAVAKITEIKPIVDSIEKQQGISASSPAISEGIVNTKNVAANDINARLMREINAIGKAKIGDGANITALQMDLVLFGAYWKIIEEGESGDKDARKLASKLKDKVVDLQLKSFPILRKRFAQFSKDLLWEHDIDVFSSNDGRTLNLTGGVFAANRNIKQTHETISENLKLFRFNEVRYRWYKGADEFTYYDIKPPKDKEPVTFEQ